MEVSFGANQTSVDEQAAATEATRLEAGGPLHPVVQTTALPAVVGNAGGFILGDKLPEFSDIILPRINIVQCVGGLKDSFTPGSIVYDQKLELFTLPIIEKQSGNVKVPALPPVNITVLGFRPTRFVEKISGGERGMIVNTEADVRAAGGTLDYNEWAMKSKDGMKRFETLAEGVIVIRRPAHVADDNTVFTFTMDGAKYALALWAMKGTAYTHAAKRVFFTARKMGCLQAGGYPSWNFSLTTRAETTKNNTYFVPVCIPNSLNTPTFLDAVRDILNPAS